MNGLLMLSRENNKYELFHTHTHTTAPNRWKGGTRSEFRMTAGRGGLSEYI